MAAADPRLMPLIKALANVVIGHGVAVATEPWFIHAMGVGKDVIIELTKHPAVGAVYSMNAGCRG